MKDYVIVNTKHTVVIGGATLITPDNDTLVYDPALAVFKWYDVKGIFKRELDPRLCDVTAYPFILNFITGNCCKMEKCYG